MGPNNNLLTPRIVHTPRFDTRHTQEVMKDLGITFPILDKDRIIKLFDWAAQRNWGRSSHIGRKLDPMRIAHPRRPHEIPSDTPTDQG